MDKNKVRVSPNIADSFVLDRLRNFKDVCVLHRKLIKNDIEDVPGFYPEELIELIEFDIIEEMWELQDYANLFDKYAEGWIQLAKIEFNMTPTFERVEFLNGTAARNIR